MKLTQTQSTAIAHITGNLQLIACAGSGKTEVVAQRVVTLLRPIKHGGGGCVPGNVIAFTFTEKAAAELKERIHERCHEAFGDVNGLAEMYVGTIHGYCLELLKSEVPKYLKYEVLNDIQQALFVDRHSKTSGLTQSTTLNNQQLKRFVDTRNYVSCLSILREDEIADQSILNGNTVANSLAIYEELLHQKGYLDYSGILKEALSALRTINDLRERLSARVKHVIVDEYQDVNPVQEAIVSELHSLGASVCVVGDDDQTLYQWRGSDVGNILTFEKRYKPVTQVQLEENFRSSEGIVLLARDAIGAVSQRLAKEMKPTPAQEFEMGDLVALPFDSREEEAQYIARMCKAVIGLPVKTDGGERGISWSDIAILLRSVQRDGKTITEALDAAKIPYVIKGMDNLFAKPEANAARQLFYFLAGRIHANDLRLAWETADLGIDEEALTEAIKNASDAHNNMANAKIGQFQVYNLQRQYMAFLETCGLREENVPNGLGEIVFYNLGKFSQIISDFESIHFHSNPAQKYESFAGFLQYQAEKVYPEGWQDNAYATPDAVQIMTVHQAKGLQWPAVFVPQLTKNRFPNKPVGGRTPWHLIPAAAFINAGRYRGGTDDERRLFYVAITRAQKYLYLTWAPTPGNQQAQSASDFYNEVLASKYVKRREQDYSDRKRIEPKPRSSVSNVVLSFSDMKYFFECPYQFKLRILYGFNAPLAEALGYGKSLHDALAEVHKRSLDGEEILPSEAQALVERHLRAPYAYPELKKKLENAATAAVAGYIEKNQSELKNLEFFEKAIQIPLGDGVSVAGRIDLVRKIDTGEVTIVDLKSSDRAQAEDVTETQLHIYALGYQQLTGRNADYVEIYELDEQKQKRRSVDDEFIADVKKEVHGAANALRTNQLTPKPKKKTCGSCDYCNLCSSALAA